MIPACGQCRSHYRLKVSAEAAKLLKKLGFKLDKKGKWKYNNKVVRSELTDITELKTKITYLEQENQDLKWYISTLENKGYEPYHGAQSKAKARISKNE